MTQPIAKGPWAQRQVKLQTVIDRFVIVNVATHAKGQPGPRIYDADTGDYSALTTFKNSWNGVEAIDGSGGSLGAVGRLVTGLEAEYRGIRRVRDVTFSFADPPLSVIEVANGDRLFNSRKPFAAELETAEPEDADWKLLLKYLLEVAAQGDKTIAAWLVKWLAWLVQCPSCKPGIAVVLQGGTGTGKSTFSAIARGLFAPYSAAFSSAHLMFGQFTGHLERQRLVGLEEALWAKDGGAADRAKDMITGGQMVVEAKGKDARSVPSAHAFVLTTNHDHAIPAMKGERRFATFSVEAVAGWEKGSACWAAIYERSGSDTIKPTLIGKLWRTLMALDLKGWQPTDNPPQTAALAKNKFETIAGTVDGWLVELVGYEAIGPPQGSDPLALWPSQSVDLFPGLGKGKEAVLSSAREYFKRHGNPVRKSDWTDDKILKALRKLGASPRRGTGGVRVWSLPPLTDARASLASALSVTVADLVDWQGGEAE